MKKTELYFGTQKPNTLHITELEFKTFVENNISRYFPGFTVTDSTGYWKGGEEKSYCVMILHEGIKVTDKLIEKIRKEYKELFNQESVLRIDSISESVSF